MFSTHFLTFSVFISLIGSAFALPTPEAQNLAARHGGAHEESDLFLREIARIAALQARQPTPEANLSGFEPDYKRSPSPEPAPKPAPDSVGPIDDLFAREITRIREAELQRRGPSSSTTITVGDVTIKQQSSRGVVEERSLDSDGDDSSADLLSAELNRISGIAKAKREAEKAELLRREIERIALVTSRPTQAQGKREVGEVVEFKRTAEGEELLRREIERIAGLQRRSE